MRGALATKQSILSSRGEMDCFASLAMTMPDGWSEAIPINTTRAPMGIASLHPSYESRIRRRDLAARCARVLLLTSRPLQTEGAGKAGCALHPRSRVQFAQKNAHTSIQVQRRASGLPCAVGYGLLRALPGERLSCHRHPQKLASANLTPAPRRQDHTTSPSAKATFVFVTSASTASHRNVRDDRDPPLSWVRRAELCP